MANTPNSEGILEFLIRLYPGGAFSNWLEGSAKIGDRVILHGPKGSRWRDGDQSRSRLFFGVNMEEELFALSAIDELKRALPRLKTTTCVWMPGSEWRGFVGTPADADALALADEGSRPDVYVCGPPALIEATKSVSVSAGIGCDRVFSEQFSPS